MAHLVGVPLPVHGASYTVISHQFVIDYSKQQLAAAGFVIVDEEYRCTADGQIAQGVYKLNFNSDPDLSMMFAWTNSYNKQVKFKCLVGAYINKTGTVMTSGELGTWTRKHTGTADTETKEMIDSQITNAHMYYAQLVADKAAMESVSLNKRRQAQMLGILFAEFQILTTEQASIVRQQMDRPSFVFNSSDSLWAFYNYVTIALQHSHPRTWLEDQRILHYFISTVCNFTTPPQPVSAPVQVLSAPVDPLTNNYGEPENQTNLLTQIAEVTGDESVLEPKLPVEPADYDFTQTVDYSKAIHPVNTDEAFKKMADDIKENNPDLHNGLSHLAKAEADMLVHGDDTAFKNITEVTEQALKDELMFGISGIGVSEDGVRNMSIGEVLEKMQEENPIPESTKKKLESDAFIGYEEDAALMMEAYEEDVANGEYPGAELEVITYTDPAGNTFEAPVVPPCAGHDAETEKDIEEEMRETEVQNFLKEVEPAEGIMENIPEEDFSLPDEHSLAPSPADYELMEAMEASVGTPAGADLDAIPVEKKEEVISNDEFDMDFSLDDEEDPENTPDFF